MMRTTLLLTLAFTLAGCSGDPDSSSTTSAGGGGSGGTTSTDGSGGIGGAGGDAGAGGGGGSACTPQPFEAERIALNSQNVVVPPGWRMAQKLTFTEAADIDTLLYWGVAGLEGTLSDGQPFDCALDVDLTTYWAVAPATANKPPPEAEWVAYTFNGGQSPAELTIYPIQWKPPVPIPVDPDTALFRIWESPPVGPAVACLRGGPPLKGAGDQGTGHATGTSTWYYLTGDLGIEVRATGTTVCD